MKVAVTLAPFGVTAAASAIQAGIQKKIYGPGMTTKEMIDMIKIITALEDSGTYIYIYIYIYI